MRHATIALAILVVLPFALLIPGCKGQDKSVGLRYIPPKAMHDPRSEPVIVLPTIEAGAPARKAGRKRVIGEIVHRSGVKQADIFAAFPVDEWTRDALGAELRSAGVNTREADTAPEGSRAVRAAITRMDSSTHLRRAVGEVIANLTIEFTVLAPGVEERITASGEGAARSSQGPLINCRDAYERAMNTLLKDAVPRILRVLGRAPSP